VSRLLDTLRRHQRTRPTPGDHRLTPRATAILNSLSSRKRPFFGWQVSLIAPLVIIVGTLVWLVVGLAEGPTVRGAGSPKVESVLRPAQDPVSLLNQEGPGVRGSQRPRVSEARGAVPEGRQPAGEPAGLKGHADAAAAWETPPARATEVPRQPAAGPAGRKPRATREADTTAGEDEHFRRALYYQRADDFENALVHYRGVLALNEMNAEAHNNLGLLYQGKGLLQDAVREFTRAIAIDGAYAKAHNNLGVALLKAGSVGRAAAEFQWVIAQDAGNVEALVNLAIAQKAGGRAEQARETLLRALGVNASHAAARYHLGLLYEDAGDYPKAIEQYEAFLKFAGSEDWALAAGVREHLVAMRGRF
jgi:Tfp pilus assembly protein PilF